MDNISSNNNTTTNDIHQTEPTEPTEPTTHINDITASITTLSIANTIHDHLVGQEHDQYSDIKWLTGC